MDINLAKSLRLTCSFHSDACVSLTPSHTCVVKPHSALRSTLHVCGQGQRIDRVRRRWGWGLCALLVYLVGTRPRGSCTVWMGSHCGLWAVHCTALG